MDTSGLRLPGLQHRSRRLRTILTTRDLAMAGSFRTPEELVEPCQGLAAGCLVYVGVDLLGGRDVRVPEDDLCIACWHFEVFEQ